MFRSLRGARGCEIGGEGSTKKSNGGKKWAKKGVFFSQKSTSQPNTTLITNRKALSEGSLGSRDFIAPGSLAAALGVVAALEWTDMV
jgi:hypothetical protein